MANGEWKVLGNEPIETLAENLWHVSGALPFGTIRRSMTIAKMSNGGLVIHSAIALNDLEMKQIESFGAPEILIVPSGLHRLDALAYKKRYPSLRVLAPRGARAKIEQLVPVDGTYEDFPSCPEVRVETLAGVADAEGAMIVNSADGTSVVLTDLMFNMDAKKDFGGWLFTTVMGSAPGPRVSRLAKLAIIKDQKALRADFERLAALPNLQRVLVAHEKIASGSSAAESLRAAASFLGDR